MPTRRYDPKTVLFQRTRMPVRTRALHNDRMAVKRLNIQKITGDRGGWRDEKSDTTDSEYRNVGIINNDLLR